MQLYVIGPVTSKPDNNIDEFKRVEAALYKAGYDVVTPHDFIPDDISHENAMLKSINKLTSHISVCGVVRKSFAVAMLADWRESPGARLEHDVAKACGIICKPWTDWL